MSDTEKKLTDKQKLFCDFYVGECRFNATKAAKMAGYSEKTAYQQGFELLRQPKIRNYIDAALRQMTLGANEVLARLTEIANGSIESFLDEEGNFDYKAAKKAGALPLLKKLKRKKTSKKIETSKKVAAEDEGSESEADPITIETQEEYEFEIHSALEALRDLGKFHKLFTDKQEANVTVSHYTMTKEEWEKQAEEKLREVNEKAENFSE